MDKQNALHLNDGIVFSHKNEHSVEIYYNINEHWNIKWNKSDTKFTYYINSFMWFILENVNQKVG